MLRNYFVLLLLVIFFVVEVEAQPKTDLFFGKMISYSVYHQQGGEQQRFYLKDSKGKLIELKKIKK